jgi:hypothetical protein
LSPALAITAALVATLVAQSAPPSFDPFAFFAPAVAVTAKDLRNLDQGGSIARVLPGRDRQVAVFAAVPLNIDGDRLVAWMRHMPELKKSAQVLSIGLFSETPRIEDLRELTLDEGDLRSIRSCEPGDCGIKLTAREIETLQTSIAGQPADWQARLQDGFREMVVARAKAYLASGHRAMEPYVDQKPPTDRARAFSAILRGSDTLTRHMPELWSYLDGYPAVELNGVESFLYWSKEHLGGKAQINVTHVAIVRPMSADLPEVVVAAKQVFTTHYLNGSLGLTVLLRGRDDSHHYLAYLNRTETDVLGGFFGGLIRFIVERRLKSDAPAILRGLRARLEAGGPTSTSSAQASGDLERTHFSSLRARDKVLLDACVRASLQEHRRRPVEGGGLHDGARLHRADVVAAIPEISRRAGAGPRR